MFINFINIYSSTAPGHPNYKFNGDHVDMNSQSLLAYVITGSLRHFRPSAKTVPISLRMSAVFHICSWLFLAGCSTARCLLMSAPSAPKEDAVGAMLQGLENQISVLQSFHNPRRTPGLTRTGVRFQSDRLAPLLRSYTQTLGMCQEMTTEKPCFTSFILRHVL